MESNFSLYNFSGIVSDNVTHGTRLMRIPPTFNEAFMTRTIIADIVSLYLLDASPGLSQLNVSLIYSS
jgi:hypothetical protein